MKTRLVTICLFLFASQVFAEECKGTDVSKWDNCHGILVNPNILKYSGEFKNGKANGQGILIYDEGTTYIGEFKNDLFHGQ